MTRLCDAVELVFARLPAATAWKHIAPLVPDEDVYVQGRDKAIPRKAIERRLARKPHFELSVGPFVCMLGRLEYDLTFLEIVTKGGLPMPEWETWIVEFAGESLISARIYDGEFEYWQNAEDPLQYQAAGRDYSHLPFVSNGKPYPLTREMIDISRNPGRRVIREGFIEAVGPVMWLSPLFFQRVGVNHLGHTGQPFSVTQVGSLQRVALDEAGGPNDPAALDALRGILFPRAWQGARELP